MLSAGTGGGPSMCVQLLSTINTKTGQTSGLFGFDFPTTSVSRPIGSVQKVSDEFSLQLLRSQGFNPRVQSHLLHLGARGKPPPSRQLVEFIEFGVNRLA